MLSCKEGDMVTVWSMCIAAFLGGMTVQRFFQFIVERSGRQDDRRDICRDAYDGRCWNE